MKKTIIISSMIIGLSTLGMAHCGGCGVGDKVKSQHEKKHTKHQLNHDHKKNRYSALTLTKAQQTQMDSINTKYQLKIDEIKKEYHGAIDAILTDTQKEQVSSSDKDTCMLCPVN
ncbi:MAG: hypothetical protein ISQ13_01265 [Candidatus Margulisbacteria bacterium]|nr:hypothetical protein [Candidatus Margulisiibacteriota bacterium]